MYVTRAKDDLHLVVPQRFFTHGQNTQGDRHVYASRTRFIPGALHGCSRGQVGHLSRSAPRRGLQARARGWTLVPVCAGCGGETRRHETSRPEPALHRSMNRQAFASRAVGGGVATKALLREIVAQECFQPLNNPDDGRTITQKTRLGARGERGDAGLAKEKRSSRLGQPRISVN